MHAGTCSCVGREQAQAAAAADREQVYRTVAFEVGVERFHVGAELGFHSSSSILDHSSSSVRSQSARFVVVCLPAKGPWDCFFLQGLCLFERPFVGLHSVVPLFDWRPADDSHHHHGHCHWPMPQDVCRCEVNGTRMPLLSRKVGDGCLP